MPGFTIGTTLKRGFPGSYAAMPDDVVRARPVAKTSAIIPFGSAVALNTDGTYSLFGASDTMAKLAGIALRTVKQTENYTNQSQVEYKPGQDADVLLRGEVSVLCTVGTPTAGGKVFLRTAANASVPAGVVGGLETAADSTNTVELTNCRWVGNAKDADNVTALCILTRNLP